MLKKGLSLVLIVAALLAVALLAPTLWQTLSPERVAGVDSLVDRIWWPTTAMRVMVYAGLAFLVFPWVVRQRLVAVEATRARLVDHTPGSPAEANRLAFQGAQLERVLRRSRWVFIAFLASDVVFAQLPYHLSRGF